MSFSSPTILVTCDGCGVVHTVARDECIISSDAQAEVRGKGWVVEGEGVRCPQCAVRNRPRRRRGFYVGELKGMVIDAADNILLVTPGSDHSYRLVRPEFGTALYHRDSDTLSEDHGEDCTPEGEGEEFGKRINVLIV